MKRISAGLCAIMALLTIGAEPTDDQLFMKSTPHARKTKAQATTFKGYALGMTLDAFKKAPVPQNANSVTRLACSDDPAVQASLGPALTPKYRGEVVCGFQKVSGHDWTDAELMLDATHGAVAAFHFFNGSLVLIDSHEDAALSDAIAQTLTAKFGQPRTINHKSFQSISDTVREQVVVSWINGGDLIVMTAPDLGTDRMSVVYRNLSAAAAMESGGSLSM